MIHEYALHTATHTATHVGMHSIYTHSHADLIRTYHCSLTHHFYPSSAEFYHIPGCEVYTDIHTGKFWQ